MRTSSGRSASQPVQPVAGHHPGGPGERPGDLGDDGHQLASRVGIVERRRRTLTGDDVAVGVAAHERGAGKRGDPLEHTDRVWPHRDEVTEQPVVVGAAASLDVRQHRVERGRVAVDVREQCEPHRGPAV